MNADAVFVTAFLMGLFGGLHCVAMCGGVVGVLCGASGGCESARGRATPMARWLAYNAGRIGAYTLLGLLFGTLGTLSVGAFPLDAVRFALRGIAAVGMLAVGLHLVGLPSMIRAVEALGAPLWKRVAPITQRFVPARTPLQAMTLGALWGLMPCGLLYVALAFAASTESPLRGAGMMAAFGVGTLPLLLVMGRAAEGIARRLARPWIRKTAGLTVLAFGIVSASSLAAQLGLGSALGVPLPHVCCASR